MKKKIKQLISFMITIFSILVTIPFNAITVNAQDETFKDEEFIELLDQIIEAETLYGLSGAQLAVYKNGNLIKNDSYGHTNNYYNVYDSEGNSILQRAKALPFSERNEVTEDTLFDMASNTKMYATVFAMQKLVSEGKISLDTKIKDIYPEFTEHGNEEGWKDKITLQHILSHYAGFKPDPQYHNENYNQETGEHDGDNYLFSQNKKKTFEMIMKTPLETEPGTSWAYSDVDMMLAGFIIETITGKDLDTYVKESFYNPLALDRITFNPLDHGFNPDEIASTELHGNTRDGHIDFENVRTEIVTGEVHDEKAFYSMDGISGHAGLFGNAQQVAYLAQAMFDGSLDSLELFDEQTIESFVEPASLETQTNGGWRRKGEEGGASAWFSKFAPAGTIGHTGWTGTLTLIDSENDLTLALFTNARNAPLMSDAFDFYTANSNVSSYGTVSELVYRGLEIGEDDLDTPQKVLENLITNEIPNDLEDVTAAKRNVVRSLLHVLIQRADNDQAAEQFLNSEFIQETIEELETSGAKDLKFLVVTKELDQLIYEVEKLNPDDYTQDTYSEVINELEESINLLEGDYTQEEIDDMYADLKQAYENLEEIDKYEPSASAKEMRKQVEELIDNDEFTENKASRLVLNHAVTLEHYEKEGKEEKIIKHLDNFKTLLNYQEKNELISEKAYVMLYSDVEHLIEIFEDNK